MNRLIRFISSIMWWRNTEKALKAAMQKGFESAFENKPKKTIKEWWNDWEWLCRAVAIILSILYIILKFNSAIL
jgi:hypothetical protein